ncbi:MAG: hypothetical protein ABW292_09250 [Vicinamibacterales bacterium]
MATQLLDVMLEVNGAYDTDASQDVLFPSPGQLQPEGYSAWGVGSLNYIRRYARGELQAVASSAVRYLPDFQEFHSVMHTGGVSIAASLPHRFGLKANAALAYSPSYLYSLFPTLPSASDAQPVLDYSDPYDLDPSSSYSSNSSIALERRISRRSTISVLADFVSTNFSNESAAEIPEIPTEITTRPDLTVYSIGGRFSRNISRDGALSVGYTYRTGEFGYRVGRTTASHSINFGANISRPISGSRRVTLSMTVGGTAVDVPEDFAQFDVVRQYRFDAEASASYPISRTWQLRGSYTRGLQYVAGLPRPVFADGFTGEFNGRVLRRIDILGRVSRAAGQSIVTRDSLLDTYTGELKVTYLVTRELNAYVNYIHYTFDSGGELDTPQIPLVTGIPADLKRDTIHVGLAWQVPAFRK